MVRDLLSRRLMNQARHKTGTWLLMIMLGAASGWACSADDAATPGVASGGSAANDGGKAAIGGKGGLGGSGLGGGGADSGGGGGEPCGQRGDCVPVDHCGPLPLAELCDARPTSCPGFDELDYVDVCQRGNTVTLRETSCGGRVVVADYDLGTDTWGFDINGVLTYRRVDGDAVGSCQDGTGTSASTVWGEKPCALVGPVTDLCGAGGGAGDGGAGDGGAGG